MLSADWSSDSQLIRSVCNAYEIMYVYNLSPFSSLALLTDTFLSGSDVGMCPWAKSTPQSMRRTSDGKLDTANWFRPFLSPRSALNLTDLYVWVVFLQGFNVMGIWPPYSNGSEVNAVDVCLEKGLVVTANDRAGLTRLFNYPCVVKIGAYIL